MLAYFDHPGTSNGPTEAINGRLEHMLGSALGFRNLTHYVARSSLETGGSDRDYTLDCDEAHPAWFEIFPFGQLCRYEHPVH